MSKRAIALIAIMFLSIGILAGCQVARKSAGTIDAPVSNQQDNSPAQIINMPNAWRNIATKCDVFQKGYRIYETRSNSNSASIPVLVLDASCK